MGTMSMVSSLVRAGIVVWLGFTLAACESARLNHLAEFAKSGIALTDSTAPLLDIAFRQAVMTNSAILTLNRADASQDARQAAILQDNESFRRRAQIFEDVKRHAKLLRAYFVAIGGLADTTGDTATGSMAKGLVEAMGEISPTIKLAKFGGMSVSGFFESVAPMAIGVFRSEALQSELRERGDAVVGEIELQQAFFETVAESMRSELQAEAAYAEYTQIVEPYLSDGSLPRDWAERRLASFARQIRWRPLMRRRRRRQISSCPSSRWRRIASNWRVSTC
jgi:hypothetical protein